MLQISVRNTPVAINFSKSNEINRNVAARNQSQPSSGPPSQHPPPHMYGNNYGGHIPPHGHGAAPAAMPPPMGDYGNYGDSNDLPSPVLLITIHKAIYPITVYEMEAILKSFGQLLRMIIFKKNEKVQALVEFSHESEAAAAKEALQGKDIYDGCCTLHVDYSSKRKKLEVKSNTERSRDFTNPYLDTTPIPGPTPDEMADEEHRRFTGQPLPPHLRTNPSTYSSQPPMMDPHSQYFDQPPNPGMHGGMPPDMFGAPPPYPNASMGMPPGVPPQGPYYGGQSMPPVAPHQQRMTNSGADHRHSHSSSSFGGGPGGQGFPSTPVVILHHAEYWRLGVQEVCNLACLYGNVNKVKRLVNKGGSFLVEMQDPIQAQGVIDYLSGLPCFGQTLQFDVSKHAHITPGNPVSTTHVTEVVPENEIPPDATVQESQTGVPRGCVRISRNREITIYGDFSQSPVNRFKHPEQFKNNIFKPSKTVHFGNAPPDLNENQVYDAFINNNLVPPNKIVIFPGSRGGRGSGKKLGLMEFPSLENAVEGIAILNNTVFRTEGGRGEGKYTVKLSFSQQDIKKNEGHNRNSSRSSGSKRSRSNSPSAQNKFTRFSRSPMRESVDRGSNRSQRDSVDSYGRARKHPAADQNRYSPSAERPSSQHSPSQDRYSPSQDRPSQHAQHGDDNEDNLSSHSHIKEEEVEDAGSAEDEVEGDNAPPGEEQQNDDDNDGPPGADQEGTVTEA